MPLKRWLELWRLEDLSKVLGTEKEEETLKGDGMDMAAERWES